MINTKVDTRKIYHERINKIISYINQHIEDQLDVETLAGIGCYSEFHFQKIMRAYLGEPLWNILSESELNVRPICLKIHCWLFMKLQ